MNRIERALPHYWQLLGAISSYESGPETPRDVWLQPLTETAKALGCSHLLHGYCRLIESLFGQPMTSSSERVTEIKAPTESWGHEADWITLYSMIRSPLTMPKWVIGATQEVTEGEYLNRLTIAFAWNEALRTHQKEGATRRGVRGKLFGAAIWLFRRVPRRLREIVWISDTSEPEKRSRSRFILALKVRSQTLVQDRARYRVLHVDEQGTPTGDSPDLSGTWHVVDRSGQLLLREQLALFVTPDGSTVPSTAQSLVENLPQRASSRASLATGNAIPLRDIRFFNRAEVLREAACSVPVFHFWHSSPMNFFHATLEGLAELALFVEREAPDYPWQVFVPESVPALTRWLAQSLVENSNVGLINSSDLRAERRPLTIVPGATWPSLRRSHLRTTNGSSLHEDAIQALARHIRTTFPTSGVYGETRVAIQRPSDRFEGWSKFLETENNRRELEIVHPELLAPDVAVWRFRTSTHLYGEGGSGLTNMVFLNAASTVIMAQHPYSTLWSDIAASLGLETVILPTHLNHRPGAVFRDWETEIFHSSALRVDVGASLHMT